MAKTSSKPAWRSSKSGFGFQATGGTPAQQTEPAGRLEASKCVLAKRPFNISDRSGDHLSVRLRWKFGAPRLCNANHTSVEHFLYPLAPSGIARTVLANSRLSHKKSGEGVIRRDRRPTRSHLRGCGY